MRYYRIDHRMITEIHALTTVFPEEERHGCGFWRMKLPVSPGMIDGPEVSTDVRKTCIQTIIDRAYYLVTIKPVDHTDTRVVASITLPELFDAQIIVFYGSDYFSSFFNRDTSDQRWLPLPIGRSLAKEWGLHIPGGFAEIGFQEIIQINDCTYIGEYWCIGELEMR